MQPIATYRDGGTVLLYRDAVGDFYARRGRGSWKVQDRTRYVPPTDARLARALLLSITGNVNRASDAASTLRLFVRQPGTVDDRHDMINERYYGIAGYVWRRLPAGAPHV